MRFAPPRDAILHDLPRSPHPTPAHHILHARPDRRVTREVVKAANGSAARNNMAPWPRQSSLVAI